MGNTPSSPQTTASSVGRHGSISRHSKRAAPESTNSNKPASALPHHRTAQLQHDPFPIPNSTKTASPLAQSATSSNVEPSSSSALVTSPSADPTSPSSLRPAGSPRRRKSLELPDLNRLSLTSMATPVPGRDTAVTSPVTRRSPLALGESYVPDSVQQGGVPSGTGKRVSLMSGTRAPHTPPAELVQDNPYFPAVPRGPLTPAALPNYSYSPLDTGAQHTEDVAAPVRESREDFSSPIQPRAGKPAPAVVTRGTHGHDPIAGGQQQQQGNPTTSGGGAGTLVSGLPQGSTPVGESVSAGDETPHAFAQERRREEVREEVAKREQRGDPPEKEKEAGGLVPTLVTWNGGGKEVFVTGTFAENGWRTRLKMNKRCVAVSFLCSARIDASR